MIFSNFLILKVRGRYKYLAIPPGYALGWEITPKNE